MRLNNPNTDILWKIYNKMINLKKTLKYAGLAGILTTAVVIGRYIPTKPEKIKDSTISYVEETNSNAIPLKSTNSKQPLNKEYAIENQPYEEEVNDVMNIAKRIEKTYTEDNSALKRTEDTTRAVIDVINLFQGAIGDKETSIKDSKSNHESTKPIQSQQEKPLKNLEQTIKNKDYTRIGDGRFAYDSGLKTTFLEVYVNSEEWKNLPKDLTKKEFYDFLTTSPIQSVSTFVFKGIPVIHPGPVNNEDIIKNFMDASDRIIKLNNENAYEFNTAKFTELDKIKLEDILRENLTSPITGNLPSLNPFAEKEKCFLFPVNSKFFIKLNNENTEIETWVNTNQDPTSPPEYTKQKNKITNPEDMETINSYIQSVFETPNPNFREEDGNIIPIDKLFEYYQKTKETTSSSQ